MTPAAARKSRAAATSGPSTDPVKEPAFDFATSMEVGYFGVPIDLRDDFYYTLEGRIAAGVNPPGGDSETSGGDGENGES